MAVHFGANSLSTLASGLQINTSADGVAFTGSTEGGQMRFLVNCRPIRYLVSQSLFPTPKSSLSTLLGCAHGTAGYTRHGHLQAVYRFWCKFAEFGTSFFDRRYEPWCAVWTRCLQLINNNIPLTTIGQEVRYFYEEAAGKNSRGKEGAESFAVTWRNMRRA